MFLAYEMISKKEPLRQFIYFFNSVGSNTIPPSSFTWPLSPVLPALSPRNVFIFRATCERGRRTELVPRYVICAILGKPTPRKPTL
jgi:hypothetical protein